MASTATGLRLGGGTHSCGGQGLERCKPQWLSGNMRTGMGIHGEKAMLIDDSQQEWRFHLHHFRILKTWISPSLMDFDVLVFWILIMKRLGIEVINAGSLMFISSFSRGVNMF